ncbi:MAG: hypothetical protein P8X62_07615 [Flavobacteriaceae bacterium]
MTKIFRSVYKLIWKYIIVEILLIFVGINLAISQNKEVAISKIKEEVKNNLEEIITARKVNQNIISAYNDYRAFYGKDSDKVITSSEDFNALQNKYPGFFRVKDSIDVEAGLKKYLGSTFIELELADLKEIAWETTKSINITNEFNYECLYELENIYNLQRRVQSIMDQAVNALQNGKINELMTILNIMKQLDTQLEKHYISMLKDIDNCY